MSARWSRPRCLAFFAGFVALWCGGVVLLEGCSHRRAPYIANALDTLPAPTGEVRQRVLLLGDGGAPPGEVVAAHAAAQTLEGRTLAVFLGDLIYPAGLPVAGDTPPDEDCYEDAGPRAQAAERLDGQLAPFEEAHARVVLVPGNHDHDHWSPCGREAVERLMAYLVEHHPEVRLVPRAGRVGPETLTFDGGRVVALDTQAFLDGNIPARTQAARGLRAQLARASEGEAVIVAAHHPSRSYGPHGGRFGVRGHLLPFGELGGAGRFVPLPVIGSLYAWIRSLGVHPQDIRHADYEELAESLEAAMQDSRPLIFAAGHEHSLQVMALEEGPEWLLVSGAASKRTVIRHGDESRFAWERLGYMQVDILEGGDVWLEVHAVAGRDADGAWSCHRAKLRGEGTLGAFASCSERSRGG